MKILILKLSYTIKILPSSSTEVRPHMQAGTLEHEDKRKTPQLVHKFNTFEDSFL